MGSDLLKFIAEAGADTVGEFLREVTFPGEGIGCYGNFDVGPDDAVEWSDLRRRKFWCDGYPAPLHREDEEMCEDWAEMGKGYTFSFDGTLRVDVCWFWDGDGTLSFRVFDRHKTADGPIRWIENTDCKKDYGWGEVGVRL